MNDPPDQTAEFNAENLLSVGGITFPKCSRKISSFSFNALSVSLKTIPRASRSSFMLWYTTSDSYCADTPAKYFCSASGIPNLSNVALISSGTSSQDFSDFSDGFT